jgi:hypothetical protein
VTNRIHEGKRDQQFNAAKTPVDHHLGGNGAVLGDPTKNVFADQLALVSSKTSFTPHTARYEPSRAKRWRASAWDTSMRWDRPCGSGPAISASVNRTHAYV